MLELLCAKVQHRLVHARACRRTGSLVNIWTLALLAIGSFNSALAFFTLAFITILNRGPVSADLYLHHGVGTLHRMQHGGAAGMQRVNQRNQGGGMSQSSHTILTCVQNKKPSKTKTASTKTMRAGGGPPKIINLLNQKRNS